MVSPAQAAGPRLAFLDGLRVAAFALLVPYHVGMYYVTWGWHVKSPAAGETLEPWLMLTSPWRLGLLFFIGGVAAQGLWQRRGTRAALADRTLRLLLPLAVGMAVVVPPQAYVEVLTKWPALLPGDGGYLDFWRTYLHGARFCPAPASGTGCLDVPTWNHLWFLPYLWAYAVLAIAAAAAWRRPLPAWQPPAWAWLLLPALPLVLARVFVFPHHPSTHDFTHDTYNHLQYGWLFGLGWWSRTPLARAFWEAARTLRWPALLLALAGWAFWVAYAFAAAGSRPSDAMIAVARTVRGALGWWPLVAACGWAQVAFRGDTPHVRRLAPAVFFLYIAHQTVIVLLTQALRPLALPWGLEAVLLVVLTFALSGLGYLACRRLPAPLALLVGVRPARGSSPPAGRSSHDAGRGAAG